MLSGSVSYGGTAQGAVNAGSYTLTASGLTSSNYTIAYVGGSLTVNKADLTVTADAQTKYAGDADPLLTYQITSGGLFGTDTLSGALIRAPGEVAGDFAILQGTLAASSNYALTYIGADLSILAAPAATAGNTGADYFTSRYEASSGNGRPATVNINYQNGGNGGAPVIGVVGGRTASAGTGTCRGFDRRHDHRHGNQNIATGSGASSLFLPISQYDKTQYTNGTLPGFAPQAGVAAVLTMIARAEENNRKAPTIDALWHDGAGAWPSNDNVLKNVSFSDGHGHTRTPDGNNGFAFKDGATDIASLLQHGPVALGGAASGGQPAATPWLLALKLTADGKGIVANDPLTGDQVILAYNPATKTVGGVTAVIDPKTGKPVPLGNGAPKLTGQKTKVPDAVWPELKAFTPTSYFAVSI